MITKRYAKAKNIFMSNYNLNEKNKYLQYTDANNLYGWTMKHPPQNVIFNE